MCHSGGVPDAECQPFVSDCHVRAAGELISHTWDPVVLSALRLGPTRRNELLMRIGGISDKVLTQSLRRLVDRGLVTKAAGSGAAAHPARAVYELSPLGDSFSRGPLAALALWAAQNQSELLDAATPEATAALR